MAKDTIRNLQAFETNIWISIETFCRKWERETPKWFFIFKQKGKCQSEYST